MKDDYFRFMLYQMHVYGRECCFIRMMDQSGLQAEGFSFVEIRSAYCYKTEQGKAQRVFDVYMVVNNLYKREDFITRMKEFVAAGGGSDPRLPLLVTIPVPRCGPTRCRPREQDVDIVGFVYGADGEVLKKINDVKWPDIAGHFTEVYGGDFCFICATEYRSSINRDVRGPGGRQLAEIEFRNRGSKTSGAEYEVKYSF